MTSLKNKISDLFKYRSNVKSDLVENFTNSTESQFENIIYLWKNSFNKSSVNTDKQIQFSKYFKFGSSINLVLNMCGKPKYVLDKKGFKMDILIYMLKVKNCDVKFELHFYDGKLFFLNYTYLDIPDTEKQHVIQAICEKHQINNLKHQIYKSVITDSDGNAITFENGTYFSVNYFAPNSKIASIAQSFDVFKSNVV
ncbi:MAG: hypothetical protein R2852_01385 [Bacteroidia bacterium]